MISNQVTLEVYLKTKTPLRYDEKYLNGVLLVYGLIKMLDYREYDS